MNEPEGYYAKWNKSKTNTVCYHFYVDSKNKTNDYDKKINWQI